MKKEIESINFRNSPGYCRVYEDGKGNKMVEIQMRVTVQDINDVIAGTFAGISLSELYINFDSYYGVVSISSKFDP